MPGDVVQAFAREIAFRDVRRLESLVADDIDARFDVAGVLVGKAALLGFWRRLFQAYSLVELHILKCVVDEDLVIADSAYFLAARRGGLVDVRAISIFEVDQGVITHWRDHADLAEVPKAETDLWRRLGGARW